MQRNIILIVDDEKDNREILKNIFEEQYRILEAADCESAIGLIKERNREIAICFVDLQMPDRTGLDVLEYLSQKGYVDSVPVIVIADETTPAGDGEKVYEYKVSDIIYKHFFYPQVVMRRAKNLIELSSSRMDIERALRQRTRELMDSRDKLEKSNEFLVSTLSAVVEYRNAESREHIHRVRYITEVLLNYLIQYYPEYQLDEEQVKLIVYASALHDLGKIAIPDSIMLKTGKLTEQEYEEVKKHTIYGCELLDQIRQEDNGFYRYCYDICRYHHERYDGSGYPDKLAGDDIPVWAQVVAIADVYDTLVSGQVYRKPYAELEAVRMIQEGECGEFSPQILDCFRLAKYELIEAMKEKFSYADGEMEEMDVMEEVDEPGSKDKGLPYVRNA